MCEYPCWVDAIPKVGILVVLGGWLGWLCWWYVKYGRFDA